MGRLWSGLIVASFVTVGVSAQEPAGQQGAQAGAGKTITVSGCVQSAPAGGGAQAADSKFVLAVKPEKGGAAGGAVGTSGAAMRYRLQGEEKTISPHLNHQVEITGTVEPMPGAKSEAGAKAEATSQTLRVTSLKMVAAVCS